MEANQRTLPKSLEGNGLNMPEVKMPKVSFDIERCKGCALCVGACPKKIVVLSKDKMNAKGFHPAEVIDDEKCITCGFCATMCPDVVIRVEK